MHFTTKNKECKQKDSHLSELKWQYNKGSHESECADEDKYILQIIAKLGW